MRHGVAHAASGVQAETPTGSGSLILAGIASYSPLSRICQIRLMSSYVFL